MDLVIAGFWSLAFTLIITVLGGLTYFIQSQNFIDKSQLDIMNQQQGRRSSGGNRRKNARNANRRKQQTTANAHVNGSDNKEEEEEEEKVIPTEETVDEKDEDEQESGVESSVQQTDEEQQHEEKFEDTNQSEQVSSHSIHIEDEQEPSLPVRQRNKNKTINTNNKLPNLPPPKEEPIVPSKPQAKVAPVKQASSSISSSNNFKSSPPQEDYNSKSYGNTSLYKMYTYSGHNPLPPRFQQQRQQEAAAVAAQKYRRRRGPFQPKRTTIPPGSAARSNDFVPSSLIQQEQANNHHNNQTESTVSHVQQQQPVSSINNGYSSESDILSDSPSTAGNISLSPLLSTSAGSQASLRGLDLVRSLSTAHVLEELISIFETVSFSSDELELIMGKIATKHIINKQDLQRLISTTKNEKTIERILDETNRSQMKILAIELQTEKNRVLELLKSNADMENMMRQLQQQQQQQQQPNNMVQYQQMVLPFQIQLKRLADENVRLQHQLHAYSTMPGSINELKHHQNILEEQLRQMTSRNNALENEVADSERASKHAAEIYKKADSQKQERIEQMIADINKYKKLDKELTTLRQKHIDLEKSLNSKIDELTHQRDDFQADCDQLKDKVQQYEQANQTNPTTDLQQELNDLKLNNDQLRQRNWKVMEELNKLLHDQKTTSS